MNKNYNQSVNPMINRDFIVTLKPFYVCILLRVATNVHVSNIIVSLSGRAKRRIQYNRRFVNVVATFGRRRGPNANS